MWFIHSISKFIATGHTEPDHNILASRARRMGEKESKFCCKRPANFPQNMSEVRKRDVTSIFFLSIILVCWITNVGAFEAGVPRSTSNKVTRPSRTEDVSTSVPLSKASSKTSLLFGLRPSSTKSTLRQRLKDKAASLLEFKNAYRIAKPSALSSTAESSATSATTAGNEKIKKSVLKRLGRLLFFPLVSELVSFWMRMSPSVLIKPV
jgi:hypothetical protein